MKTPVIKVVGVGGGGSNAVNFMHRLGIKDVTFAVCNTDAQALAMSPVEQKIQLGRTLTEGRGAGNKPEQGRLSAIESMAEIEELLSDGTGMIFVTAGMGGGTGTGAAPEIARVAYEKGILTIAIVTIPFRFEGKRRIDQAVEGITRMAQNVDSLLVINNEKLREIHGNLGITEAFSKADNVLATAAKGIAEIITIHGMVNVDFSDVNTVLRNSGVAVMGTGVADGPDRAIQAISQALESPLLESNHIRGAANILMNICTGGKQNEMTMGEVTTISNYVQECAGNTNIIWGTSEDPNLGTALSVTIIAAGFDSEIIPLFRLKRPQSEGNDPESKDGGSMPGNPNPGGSTTFRPGSENQPQALKAGREPEVSTKAEIKAPEKIGGEAPGIRLVNPPNPSLPGIYSLEELENIPAYIRRNLNIHQLSRPSLEYSELVVRRSDDSFSALGTNRFLGRKLD